MTWLAIDDESVRINFFCDECGGKEIVLLNSKYTRPVCEGCNNPMTYQYAEIEFNDHQ